MASSREDAERPLCVVTDVDERVVDGVSEIRIP